MPTDWIIFLIILCCAILFAWRSGFRFANNRHLAKPQEKIDLPANYMRGLNFMLNEQPDKALDVFIQMVQVDSDTVETHFALGSLYRQRGEIDRAIRIHQNLIARPNLNVQDKQLALFNLAEDYLAAGLMDRAEALYRKVEKPGDIYLLSRKRLISLLEQQKEWQEAIDLLKASNLGGENSEQLSHYYCELAEESYRKNDLHTARQLMQKAYIKHTDFLRANLIEARILVAEGDKTKAVVALNKILDKDAKFASELLPDFYRLANDNNQPELFDDVLKQLVKEHPHSLGILVSALVRHNLFQSQAAKDLLQDYLISSKSFSDFNASIEGQNYSFETALQILRLAGLGKSAYQCSQCGYGSTYHQWNCPGCKNWGTAEATSLY